MTGGQEQFLDLMQRVRAGSDDAARELLEAYGHHIYRTVRRRLSRELRSKFDSADFAQAVWGSFFANREVVLGFDRPEVLVAFLARMASNKVIDECRRRFGTAKHNVNRERSLDRSAAVAAQGVAADTPSPSRVVVAREQWEQVTAGQPAHYRRMAELRAGGATYDQIASELGVDEKTVRRALQRLARRIAE